MKKFLFGLIGLVAVAVAALLVVPDLWDWNAYKPESKWFGCGSFGTADLRFLMAVGTHLT